MNQEFSVSELGSRDAGRGLARLPLSTMNALGVRSGAVLEVRGTERSTAVKIMPAAEAGTGLALDAQTRANAGVAVGQTVQVQAIQPPSAKTLQLEAHGAAPSSADLKTLLQDRVVCVGDRLRLDLFAGKSVELTVIALEPQPIARIGMETRVALAGATQTTSQPAPQSTNYDDIGGLQKEVSRVRELVELPLRYPEVFVQLGIEAPKGVLLYGPPGTGKTTIARAVARETKAHFISVAAPEIIGKFYGDSEKRLREVFEQATKKAPSIIFIDEIDAIGTKRSEVEGEVEKRVVAQLLALMDGLGGRGQVVVMAATNLPDRLDPALRRPGRFDREVQIAPPNAAGRLEILYIHTRGMPLSEDVNLERIAGITHGFVGADLAALCREAAMTRLRLEATHWKAAPSAADLLALEVRQDDFFVALRELSPSLIRENQTEIEEASWADIGGLREVKQALREAIELPLQHPELFARLKLEPPRGILLAGAPGTGKTLLARAVARETQANFIAVRGAQLISKYVGESEKAVRELFAKARQSAPCVIFFDEIDALLGRRDAGSDPVIERVVGQFLAEMDGVSALGNVVLLGATNRPDALDAALLRPGRFERVLEMGLPSVEDRLEILSLHLRQRPHAPDLDLAAVVQQTEGWSGAKLAMLIQRAALLCVRKAVQNQFVPQTQNDMHNPHSISTAYPLSSGHPYVQISQDDLHQALTQLT